MSQNSDHLITFNKVLSPDMLESVKELYLNSFPPEERRTLEGLENQLLEPQVRRFISMIYQRVYKVIIEN